MIQVALNAVFPPDKIQSVTGVKNVGTICNLDTETILKPIAGFVPNEQPVEEIKVPEELQSRVNLTIGHLKSLSGRSGP